MRIDHHHYIHLDDPVVVARLDKIVDLVTKGFHRQEDRMSQLSDRIAAAESALDAAIARVQSDVTDQGAEIARLKELVANGSATQEDLDRLDVLTQKLNALDPVKPDVLPPE